MITLKDFLPAVHYRITEGSDFGWICYGPNAFALDSWDGDPDGVASSVIFDTKTQEVYEVQLVDYSQNKAWRVINPDFIPAYNNECNSRGHNRNEAWDDVEYTDVDESTFMSLLSEAFKDTEPT